MDVGQSLRSWLEDWVLGVDLWQRMVVLGDTRIQKPLTKEWITIKTVKGIKGNPYLPSVR
jgi:hypothetical protein